RVARRLLHYRHRVARRARHAHERRPRRRALRATERRAILRPVATRRGLADRRRVLLGARHGRPRERDTRGGVSRRSPCTTDESYEAPEPHEAQEPMIHTLASALLAAALAQGAAAPAPDPLAAANTAARAEYARAKAGLVARATPVIVVY